MQDFSEILHDLLRSSIINSSRGHTQLGVTLGLRMDMRALSLTTCWPFPEPYIGSMSVGLPEIMASA